MPASCGSCPPKTIGRLDARRRTPRSSNGVKQLQDGNYAAALALFSTPALANTALADYAAYYKGVSQLRQGQLRKRGARSTR